MANQMGKRYRCSKCGAEFIVTKAGEGMISCCGQPMELKSTTNKPKEVGSGKPTG